MHPCNADRKLRFAAGHRSVRVSNRAPRSDAHALGTSPRIKRWTTSFRSAQRATRGSGEAGAGDDVTPVARTERYPWGGPRTNLRFDRSCITRAATDAPSAAIVVASRDSTTITCSKTVGLLCST